MARRSQERPAIDLKTSAPSSRRSVADSVAESLREAILSHTLPGGTPLIEKQLAEEFGVSKTPVREALLRLAHTGLVDFAHAKGATVHRLGFKEMQDLLEMRQTLEPLALRQSAPNLDRADLTRLEKTLESAARAQAHQHFGKLGELDTTFHNLLYSKADNRLLLAWLEGLNDRRRLISVEGWRCDNRSAEELADHKAILAAVGNQEHARAVELLERHLKAFSDLVLRHHPLAEEAA